MLTLISNLFRSIGLFLGLLKSHQRTKELQDAQESGAAKASVAGSKKVDSLLLDALAEKDDVSDSENAIISDPDNRANDR